MIDVTLIPPSGEDETDETRMAKSAVEHSVRFAAVMLDEYASPGLVIYSLIVGLAWVSKHHRPKGMTDREAIDDIVTGIKRVFANIEMRDVTAHYHSEGGKA